MHKSPHNLLQSLAKLCYGTSIAVFWAGITINLETLEKTISQRQAQEEFRQINKYHLEEKVNPYLFISNLESTKLKESWPISQALTKTVNALKNTYPNCPLTTSEISTILLSTNEDFKYEIIKKQLQSVKPAHKPANEEQKLQAKLQQEEQEKKVRTLQIKSCQKLSKCILPEKSLNPISFQTCANIINQEYLNIQQAMQENQEVSEANLGNNKYRNGDTKDSDFDILHDIAQVGKVLFEDFKPQPELIFYKIPDFNNKKQKENWWSWPQTSSGWTNPTTPWPQTSWSDPSNNSGTIPRETDEWPTNPQENIIPTNNLLSEDASINAFIQNTQTQGTTLGNQNLPLFQNLCLPPGSTTHTTDTTSTWITNISSPLGTPDQQQTHQENTQTILQNLSKTNLGAPLTSQTSSTPWSLATTDTSWTPQQQIEAEKKALETCMKKCDWLPYDEKTICKLQCLCWEISSPEITIEKTVASTMNGGKSDKHALTDMMKKLGSEIEEELTFPIVDAWALRIRFCTIPSKIIQPNTSSKTIYSISEIINELYNVTNGLANGGKLSTNKKSDDFLSSTKVAGDLSQSTSISANLGTKTSPIATTKKELETENTIFYNQLLNNNKSIWRNSYIVQAKYDTTSSQQKNSIKPDNSAQAPDTNDDLIDIEHTITTQNIGTINDSFADFLQQNNAFLDALYHALDKMNSTLAGLKNKK